MKKFITYTVFFICPVIIIMVVMEFALRQIPNDYKLKSEQIELKKEAIETLILGSSHSMYGFNPEYFTNEAYNLSHVSQSIDLDYLLLQKYINELPKLKTIVIRLSYTTLHEQLGETSEAWRQKDYNLYYDLDISNTLKFNSEVLSIKLKNNIKRLRDYYLKNENPISVENSGWAFFNKTKLNKSLDELGVMVAKKHTAKNDKLVEENITYLEKIVKLCGKQNVKVIIVTLPAYKSYRAHLNKSQLEKVISTGVKMYNNYSNCSYLNLIQDENFNENDFYDADHLNTNGAKKLSLFLDDFIIQSYN
ncbi:DUF1574 family protein [Winogradskyella litoriviva]|uniref:DUF1574 family protein n=1 Tax=Winogradskyella litoriviva TaxID=1220182 RepID=A0ABX2E903_9FLAO|nr:DUF1574 family protein [Winogradskyella litoriviva]NRD24576.1 DUF1574 family protein [Winogradskyella litoriviva]